MIRPGMTMADLLRLPAVVDVPTAAKVLRIGRTTAYRLAAAGQFPVPVIRAGGSYRVATAELAAALGLHVNACRGTTHDHHDGQLDTEGHHQ